MFDLKGKVAIVTGGNVGIGFAVPIDLAKKVVDQLRKNGRVVRGWLGIRAQDVSPQLAASLALTRNLADMAVVTEVGEGSPAAEAGVKPGDVVLELNGKPVPRSQDFPSVIADTAPGQKVTLKRTDRCSKDRRTARRRGRRSKSRGQRSGDRGSGSADYPGGGTPPWLKFDKRGIDSRSSAGESGGPRGARTR